MINFILRIFNTIKKATKNTYMNFCNIIHDSTKAEIIQMSITPNEWINNM